MATMSQAAFDYVAALWHDPKERVVARDGEILVGCSSLVYNEALMQARIDRESAEREARLEELRQDSQNPRPPLWVVLPAQFLAILAWIGLVVVLGVGWLVLGSFVVIGEGIGAIVRGVRWVLC